MERKLISLILAIGMAFNLMFCIVLSLRIIKDDPQMDFVDISGETGKLSSTNFDFSPDGQTIVYLDRKEGKLKFTDTSGRFIREVSFADRILGSPVTDFVDSRFKHLQWYSENSVSFIFIPEEVREPDVIYSFNFEDLTFEQIHADVKSVGHYCWANFGETLFILEYSHSGKNIKVLDMEHNVYQTSNKSIGSSILSCDDESSTVLTAFGDVFEYDGLINFHTRLEMKDTQFYISNFSYQRNSFYAVKRFGDRIPLCIAFEGFYNDERVFNSIADVDSFSPKFVVSEESQNLLIETKKRGVPRLSLLSINISDDGVFESPNLASKRCHY